MMDRATSRYRATLAVEYRMQGMSYDTIAETLGFASRAGAWKAVDRWLSRRGLEVSEQHLRLMMADLQLLHDRAWKNAMAGAPGSMALCHQSHDMQLRLINRYAKASEAAA